MGQLSVVHVNVPPHPNAVRFYCGRAPSYQAGYGVDCSVLGNPFVMKCAALSRSIWRKNYKRKTPRLGSHSAAFTKPRRPLW
jgi:hypothetical protein